MNYMYALTSEMGVSCHVQVHVQCTSRVFYDSACISIFIHVWTTLIQIIVLCYVHVQ